MRNLRNIARSVAKFAGSSLPLTATAWDASSASLICAFGPSEASAVIEIRRLQDGEGPLDERLTLIASWDAPSPNPELAVDNIVSLQYFSDTSMCCLILAGGDIVIVREDPLPGEDMIEIVGSVDAGISSAAWSPDEELLVISTNVHTLLYMTRDFENITSATLNVEDVKLSKHVNVGWGKRETQFQGKRAKALRDPTMPEKVDEGVLSPLDDKRVTISWRGDGAYMAINTIEENKRRMIRVYTREGVLDSVSEPVDGLEGALSWRPAGNLMAGVQRFEDRVDIVFFERNGLRHGQFSLRLSAEDLSDWGSSIDLRWNCDSSCLAICFKDRVQLWTMGNYHYYLKKEIRNPDEFYTGEMMRAQWHPERPLCLALSCSESLQSLEYAFVVSGGPTSPPSDYGLTPVIDGCNLKLTPLRVANVPPPMARHEVALEKNAKDVAVNASSTQVAVLCEADVYVYEYDVRTKPTPEPALLWNYTAEPGYNTRQICFRGESEVHVLAEEAETGISVLLPFDGKANLPISMPQQGRICTLSSTLDWRCICVEYSDGSMFELSEDDQWSPIAKLPKSAPWVQVAKHGEETIAFALTANGALFANGRVLVRNCTSFLVTAAHVLFTTTQHHLKFIHMAPVNELEVPPDEPEKDERCRAIERGAKLVAVMPSVYSVVLQMPRGNLETIYPRALVLAGIRRAVESLDYKTAFLACRNQRVDMNILHDHAPAQFMSHVKDFIKQVKKAEHIDLFLSQLRDEDVAQTMYRETSKKALTQGTSAVQEMSPSTNSTVAQESKVNRICDAFLQVLETETASNLQNIITAHVCKQPPALEAGLRVVAKLQGQEELAERAAEHICFLADVNRLYDSALGLYNLELALLIAQQSQKDPREYLPYLESLQGMTPLRRQFAIDDALGRHEKALTHLFDLSAFEELKSYVEEHELYSAALELYKYQPAQLSELTRLYADFLHSRNRFREAGLAYESLSLHALASENYRLAHMWRESLSSASLASDISDDEVTALAETLADALTESSDFLAAATIHLDYLADVETAAKLFCRGHWYAEAMRIVALKGRRELLTEIIDPGLIEGSGSTTELLAEFKGQLNAQVPRLRELRQKKREDPLAFFGGEAAAAAAAGVDIPDNVSLAPSEVTTSGGTFMTRYTGSQGTVATGVSRKTSKNRRREERKRARGKKGTVYEEGYLVSSIERLIERVNLVSDEISRLVEGLVRRGMRERAEAVERGMVEVVTLCEGCVGEVWEAEEKPKVEGEEERPSGADGVLWDALHDTGRKKEPPVVKKFKRLNLLG